MKPKLLNFAQFLRLLLLLWIAYMLIEGHFTNEQEEAETKKPRIWELLRSIGTIAGTLACLGLLWRLYVFVSGTGHMLGEGELHTVLHGVMQSIDRWRNYSTF